MPDKPVRSWEEFKDALAEHFGSLQRAQTNFCENTNFSLSSLQHWRKTDRVPEDAFTALVQIDKTKCPPSLFRGRLSGDISERVVELSGENKTLSEIASILAEETKRPVTENMIKGIRYRNKHKIANYQSRKEESHG